MRKKAPRVKVAIDEQRLGEILSTVYSLSIDGKSYSYPISSEANSDIANYVKQTVEQDITAQLRQLAPVQRQLIQMLLAPPMSNWRRELYEMPTLPYTPQ